MLDTEDVTLGESLTPESCAEHWGRGSSILDCRRTERRSVRGKSRKKDRKRSRRGEEHLFLHERIDKFAVKSSKERCPDPHPL